MKPEGPQRLAKGIPVWWARLSGSTLTGTPWKGMQQVAPLKLSQCASCPARVVSGARSSAQPRNLCPQTVKFRPGERFAFDGKARLPNFLNGRDGQMGEARAHIRPVDTSTHTTYDWSGAGAGLAGQSLAADLARSLNGVSSLRAGAARSSTARSLVAADTRYHHLAEPAAEHVGPGTYAVERARPGLGPMPLDSHTSSSQPQVRE